MGRVLAIEPEASKAEALRQIVRNDVGAEFVLVTSAYAAVVAINRQLPDLVLFSESISDRHRERVVDHLKSVSRNGTPPTLSIPALRNGDRAAFVTQIGAKLGQKKPIPPATTGVATKPPASAPILPPTSAPIPKAHPAVPRHDIDPVELELLSQASALETDSSHDSTDDLAVASDVGAEIAARPAASRTLADDVVPDRNALEIPAHSTVDSTHGFAD